MVDIAGTKKKIQRVVKVAEETYKKINEVIEEIEQLQEDLETTSGQVDNIESELAEQRALLEALAEEHDIDVDEILADVEYPDRLLDDRENGKETKPPSELATSQPSAADDRE